MPTAVITVLELEIGAALGAFAFRFAYKVFHGLNSRCSPDECGVCGDYYRSAADEFAKVLVIDDVADRDPVGHLPAAIFPRENHALLYIPVVDQTEGDIAAVKRLCDDEIVVAHRGEHEALNSQIVLIYVDKLFV